MGILCAREMEQAAKLTPDQMAALKDASMKKRFRLWNRNLITIEFVMVPFLLLFALIYMSANFRAGAVFFTAAAIACGVAGAIQAYTYLLALKVYDQEEIKTAIVE